MDGRHNSYDFKFKSLPKLLQYSVVNLRGVPRNWEKPRESLLQSPKPLADLAAHVVDSEPLPECMYWATEEVEDWMAHDLKLPQYKICFRENYIKGRHLILLEPNQLLVMGIHQFDHIKTILTGIRALFHVPMPRFARDLTLPSIYGTAYDCVTLYYCHVSQQSPEHATPRSVYWRKVGLLHTPSQPEYSCHWHTISADTEGNKVWIGRYRRKKPEHYWVPMFREGNFVPTQQNSEDFFMNPLCW